MPEWREREVANESDSRALNEIVNANAAGFGGEVTAEFVCECGDDACTTAISMTSSEYEGIRAEGATFMVAPRHENPEIDMVMTEGTRFSVIRKLPGFAARQAIASDPRRTGVI